jgi:hypothetical protein
MGHAIGMVGTGRPDFSALWASNTEAAHVGRVQRPETWNPLAVSTRMGWAVGF